MKVIVEVKEGDIIKSSGKTYANLIGLYPCTIYKKKEYERFIPCKCGCNRRRTYFGYYKNEEGQYGIKLVCYKCGEIAFGKNSADAKRNWNKKMRVEDKK